MPRAEIRASFTKGIAADADLVKRRHIPKTVPDVGREIFHGRRPEPFDLVQKTMIEHLRNLLQAAFQYAKIFDPTLMGARAFQPHFGLI